MRVGPASKVPVFLPMLAAAAVTLMTVQVNAQTTLEIGIGTQNTTTNTVTGGVVIKEMKLLEKHLPKTGKYKDSSTSSTGRTSPPARRSPTA